MRIEHIAIWVKDIEKEKSFYEKYFDVTSSELYHNHKTGFKSYFLCFDDGVRLEIMSKSDINKERPVNILGYAHISIAIGSIEKVNEYTEIFRKDGYKIISEARTTGDGYYESVILDPENNLIELTV
jgi:lactoylglutathione lyase